MLSVARSCVTGRIRTILFLVVALGCAAGGAVGAAGAATSPRALRAAIRHATSLKYSVHYVTVSSANGVRMTMVSDCSAGEGIQRITFSRSGKTGHATTLVVYSTAYIRGDAFTLHSLMGLPASLASSYAGKWILIPNTSSAYQTVAVDVTFGSFIHDLVPQHHLTLVSGTVGGRKMRGLRGTAPHGGTTTVYVPPNGTPLPLSEIQDTRGAHPATSRVSMSHWNEIVRVQAPAHAIALP